jgi:hypothetical protein
MGWEGGLDLCDAGHDRDRDKSPYVVNTLLHLRVLYRGKLLAERSSVSEEGRGCVELVALYLQRCSKE